MHHWGGTATARSMVGAGARVAILDRDERAAISLVKALESQGAKAIAIATDVSDRSDIEAALKRVVDNYGRLDIMVDNAGISRPSRTAEVSEELWDDVIGVNLSGVFWGCQVAFSYMREAGYGRILNTSSTSSLGSYANASYASTKAGVVAMTRSLAMEYGKYGVTVNAVGPGMITAPMTDQTSAEIKQRWIRKTVVGRLGEPEDVARLFLFLALPGSSYITGQMIFVDGGYTLPTMKA
ncbi:MAG: SDR family NAD(P)-dependent oxidoreductase [Proteobacteria bacterium]|nr:SDR family NAD(P)-dependent oxidoreductase [Pseudomonadota bacterium]